MRGRSRHGGVGVLIPSDAPAAPTSTHEIRMTLFYVEVALSTATPTVDPVPDPTTGGTVTAGTNPDPGDSICGEKEPVAWDEVEYNGTTYRYAKVPINVGDPKEPRVQTFGPVRRALSNAFGDNRGATVNSTLIDTDGVLRGLENSDSLIGCRYTRYVSSKAILQADPTSKTRVFDGVITDTEPGKGRVFSVQVTDYLTTLLDEFSKRTFPQRVFTLDDFPNMGNDPSNELDPGNPTMVGKPVPIGYGQLSDEQEAEPVGVASCVYTGKRAIAYYDNALWDEYVFFGHAPGAFQSLFIPEGPTLSTGTTYPSRTRITAATPVVEYLFPGTDAWTAAFGTAPYREFNGNRYCVVYGFGPRSELNRTGQVPLVANLWGVEDVGDGTGDVITNLYRQILHLLVNWIFGNYISGAWLSPPTVGSGGDLYSRIDTASFAALKTLTDTLLSPGVEGAFILGYGGQAKTLSEILTTAATNGHFQWGQNRHGQMTASMLDTSAATNRTITALADILAQTYTVKRRRDMVRNVVTYRCGRRYVPPLVSGTPAEGELLPVQNTQKNTEWLVEVTGTDAPRDSASVTKYGERPEDINFEFIRDSTTAASIAQLILDENATPPVLVSFDEGPCGVDTDLGDVDEVTHFDALSETARTMRDEEHTLNCDTWVVSKTYREL